MSDITCPFDDDFCQKKQDRLNEWKKFVLKNSNTNINFRTTLDMFWDCPIKHLEEREETCERYRRYCTIVNKVMNGVEQSLKQMIKDKTISVNDKPNTQENNQSDLTPVIRAIIKMAQQQK